MRMKKLLAILPAWMLVGAMIVVGAGTTGCWFCGPPPPPPPPPPSCDICGDPCGFPCPPPDPDPCGFCDYRPSITINQANVGDGNVRLNQADAVVTMGGYTGTGYSRGASIDIDQLNLGNGDERDNVAYADFIGGTGWPAWYGGDIDINQENLGDGHNRGNGAFATWSW